MNSGPLANDATDPADAADAGGTSSELSTEPRVLRPRRAAPADALRPTRAEVNLGALRHNLRVLERKLAAASTRAIDGSSSASRATRTEVWGVLKADAYGHGAPAVARTLERAGIPGLCVALLEEGIELRAAGIRAPILVMGGLFGLRQDGIEEMLENDLVPVVHDIGQIERIADFARFEGKGPVPVHLKIDTGMGRLGVSPGDLDHALDVLARRREIRVDGLMTHFACADARDLEVTRGQLADFARAEAKARAAGLSPRVRHAANSAATLQLADAHLDMVRPGIALFGVTPFAQPASGEGPDDGARELKPVMRVRSEIAALRTIAPGGSIGYGHTWTATRPSVIATVPMGYADGLNRQLSNRGHALVRGKRAPIAGAVSMDLTMIDVTEHAQMGTVRLGDEAVFLGPQEGPLGKDVIGSAEVAAHTGSIPWEILTSISRRVPRFYREP